MAIRKWNSIFHPTPVTDSTTEGRRYGKREPGWNEKILGKTESYPYAGHTHAKDETQVLQMLKRTLIHKPKVFTESIVTSRTRTSQILSILLYSLFLMLYPR